MATTFGFFSDAALTTPLSARLLFTQAVSSPAAVDKVVYFGSATASRKAMANSAPGVDPIVISITDAAGGSGSPTSDVKLALSSGGLAAATGGASLTLPVEIDSGSANAIPIHIRVLDSTHAFALNQDLSLTTNTLAEFSV